MKIAIWNVNSIKARLEHVKKWLGDAAPDILMIQELKGEAFPAEVFEALGYQSAAVGQKAYNGVATLSRYPIQVIAEALPGDDGDIQARYLETEINGVRFINIYAPNGNPVDSEKFPYKLAWLDRLTAHVMRLRIDNVPVVIGGDYNIIPEDKDCYDPKAWINDALFQPESRRKYRTLVNLGLTDAYRVFDRGSGAYTFWDYQAGAWPANKGIRIDHFLVSPSIADRLKACHIDKTPRGWDKASDHTPVVVEIA